MDGGTIVRATGLATPFLRQICRLASHCERSRTANLGAKLLAGKTSSLPLIHICMIEPAINPADRPMRSTSALLDDVLGALTRQHGDVASITLGALVDALGSRAFGLFLLLMALPCCLPFIYGLPQIVAFPMLFLVGQLALGREILWLPESLRKRSFRISTLASTVHTARPWLDRLEFLAGPRIRFLSEGRGLQIVAILLLVPCASILIPLPLTNSVPGLGVAIASVGLVQRDGLLIVSGLFIGLFWVAALITGGEAAISFLISLVRG